MFSAAERTPVPNASLPIMSYGSYGSGTGTAAGGTGARVGPKPLDEQLAQQQLSMRKKILDLLLGNMNSGGGQGGASGGGIASLLEQLSQAGAGSRNVINENFNNLASSTMSRFDQYGVGGSSGVPSVLSGIERQRGLALGELDDSLIMNKVGVQERGMDRALQAQSLLTSLLG